MTRRERIRRRLAGGLAWLFWALFITAALVWPLWLVAVFAAAGLACWRARRGWPVTARLIFWWEISRLSSRGGFNRWSLSGRFVRVDPEPHKSVLGDSQDDDG
jgi:hypothetical protein